MNPRTLTRPPGPAPADIVGPSEKLLLDAQGACKNSLDSGWKLGRMILTEKRLLFLTNNQIKMHVPLDRVISVETERQPFVLASTAVLRVASGKEGTRLPRALWLVTKKIEAWRDALLHTTILEVTDQVIERVAYPLDDDSAALLRYVWNQHHAGMDELAELIDAPDHPHVLAKIRERINPAAVNLLGCSILVFRRSWKASGNSEPIENHWWIAGKRKAVADEPAAQVNVFKESVRVDVVADLPGVTADDVLLNVVDNRLIISAASDTQKFHHETHLPPGTHPETMTWRINNGTLLVRFRRGRRRKTA